MGDMKVHPEVWPDKIKEIVELRAKGIKYREISRAVNLSQNYVIKLFKRYERHGWQGVVKKKRGRHFGSQRKLSQSAEEKIRGIIFDEVPEKYDINQTLWTRDSVQTLISRKLRLDLPIRTVGEYLRRWGFVAIKPPKRGQKNLSVEQQQWLNNNYREILNCSHKAKATIVWMCWTKLPVNDDRNPHLKRLHFYSTEVSIISAVTNAGQGMFLLWPNAYNVDVFMKKFMRKLCKMINKSVILIVQELDAHDGERVKHWTDGCSIRKVYIMPRPSSGQSNL